MELHALTLAARSYALLLKLTPWYILHPCAYFGYISKLKDCSNEPFRAYFPHCMLVEMICDWRQGQDFLSETKFQSEPLGYCERLTLVTA